MTSSYMQHQSASNEYPYGARADSTHCSQNCRGPKRTQSGGRVQSKNKNWPPASVLDEEPLTRTSILQTPVYLGAAKFGAHAHRRPWNDTLMYLVYEGSSVMAPSIPLLSGQQLVLFEQFYPPQPGSDLVDPNCWISGRGADPGTVTFAKWINDAAPQLMYTGTSGAPFPSPLSTSVKEYFIRISTLCKDGLDDPVSTKIKIKALVNHQQFGLNKMDLYESLLTPLNVKYPSLRTAQDEIVDIMDVLLSSNFLDLSLCRNQVLAQLLYEGHDTSWFMLLLSLHLYLRLEQAIPEDRGLWLKILRIVPPKIAHYLMLAHIWIANCTMSIDQNSDIEEATMFYNFVIPRANQIDSLKEFARAIEWPDLERVEQLPSTFKAIIDEVHFCKGNWMETWVRGLVLPGPVSSFLLLGSLLDLSVDNNADQYLSSQLEASLVDLEQRVANFGLLIHESSYWHLNCIVGKVLGPHPDVWQVGDWICGIKLRTYSSDHRFIRIAQIPTQHTIQECDIEKLTDHSNPAGDSKAVYSIEEFEIPVISFNTNLDHVQFLSAKFAHCYDEQDSTLHYAHLRFLIGGHKCYRPLRYNVDFVGACVCHNGPHPLHKKYLYKTIKAKKLIRLNAWGHANVDDEYEPDCDTLPESAIERVPERVLVITASHADEEILARAWCSNLGLSAIVGNLTRSNCSACIIRQAFISRTSVIILTCKPSAGSKDHDSESDLGTPRSSGSKKSNSRSSSNRSVPASDKVTGGSFHEVSLDATDLIASGGKNIKISFKAQPSPTGSHSNGNPFVVNLTLNVSNSDSVPSPAQNSFSTHQPTVEDCTDEDETETQIHTPTEHETSEEGNPSAERPSRRSHHVNRSKSTPSLRARTTTIPSTSASFPSAANATYNDDFRSTTQNESTKKREDLDQTQKRHRESHRESHRGRQSDRDKNKEPHQARHSRSTARGEPAVRRRGHSKRDGTRHGDKRRAGNATFQFIRQSEAVAKSAPGWLSALRGMFTGKSERTGGSGVRDGGNSGKSVVKEVRRLRRGEVEFVLG